jgi:hypothetical protein
LDDEFQGQVIDLSKRKELPCNLDEMATRARSQSYALLKTPTSNDQTRISNGELRHEFSLTEFQSPIAADINSSVNDVMVVQYEPLDLTLKQKDARESKTGCTTTDEQAEANAKIKQPKTESQDIRPINRIAGRKVRSPYALYKVYFEDETKPQWLPANALPIQLLVDYNMARYRKRMYSARKFRAI